MKSLVPFLAVVILLVLSPAAVAQPGLPSDIQEIMKKLAQGAEITEAEQERLDAWTASMDEAIEQFEKSQGKAEEERSFPGAPEVECPKAKTVKDLPVRAPDLREYIALVQNIAARYGAKAGNARAGLDRGLQRAPEVQGGDVGAVLAVAQAGSAAAYVTAKGILKDPSNFLSANNLGVILNGMEDHASALSVLLYADKMRPNVPLVQVNIGWVYYDIGDRENARKYFRSALRFHPEFSGAHNGLGLLCQCEGNQIEAMAHFRQAFKTGFSRVGAMAYRAARQKAAEADSSANPSEPISEQKEGAGSFKVPEPPLSEKAAGAQAAKAAIEQMTTRIDERLQKVREELVQVSETLRRQNERSSQDPNALVLPITFDKQIFLFQDITETLLGESSRLGQALKTTRKEAEQSIQAAATAMPDFVQSAQKVEPFYKRMEELFKAHLACGDDEGCQEQVKQRIDQLKYEMDQEEFKTCKRAKEMLEANYTHRYKGWKAYHDEAGRTLEDYIGFTTPVIADVYAPTLNEYMNLFREGQVLLHEKMSLDLAANLPDIAENIESLDCHEPEPPTPASSKPGGDVQKEGPPDCPFGKPITVDLVVVDMELDCDHVKIEGGEGLVASYKRDFVKKETTIGIGVGAGISAGVASARAKIMVEITESGDTVSDVALKSSLAGKLGGGLIVGRSAGAELGGQISLESGPSITSGTSSTLEVGPLGIPLS
ncbi:MAG TPA: hypothetical protein PLP42_02535 [Acidobacteriota bacterium]|nr:hypothetical protein [Acidobacteriota bacterium]